MFKGIEQKAIARRLAKVEAKQIEIEVAKVNVREILSYLNEAGEDGITSIVRLLREGPTSKGPLIQIERMRAGETEFVLAEVDKIFGVPVVENINRLRVCMRFLNGKLESSFVIHKLGESATPFIDEDLLYESRDQRFIEKGRQLAAATIEKHYESGHDWSENGDMLVLLSRFQEGENPYIFWALQKMTVENVVETLGVEGVDALKAGLVHRIEETFG